MTPEIILSVISGAVAIFVAAVTFLKWRQEKRIQAKNLQKLEDEELAAAVRIEVLKESVAIKGAQDALTLMERMLAVAAASESKLQIKVAAQAEQISHLEDENQSLKARVRAQDQVIDDLRCRIESLEKKDENNG